MTIRKSETDAKPLSGTNAFSEARYVWLFQCSARMAVHAATLDSRGRNLPHQPCAGGTWTKTGQLLVGPDPKTSVGMDIDALKAGIEQNGYYLWNADMVPLPDSLNLMR